MKTKQEEDMTLREEYHKENPEASKSLISQQYVGWLENKIIESRRISDTPILSAVPSELLEKLEELSKIVPIPPKAITYENGVEIVDFVQDTIMPEYYNWIKRGIAG